MWHLTPTFWYAFTLALFTGLGSVLLLRLPKYRWLTAGILLAVLTPLALAGFGFANGQWGISDWDYYFSLHENWRQTILQYHQVPLWNPYTCGGTAGLGDPEFSVFTLSYALEIIFGVPTGLRLAIYLMTFLGGLGMLLLARRLRLSPVAGFLIAIIYAFGSVNLLEIVEGHPNILAAGWIPWVFWTWLGAYRSQLKFISKDIVVLSIFLALTFYQGGIYLLMYTALAFLLLPWLTKRPLHAYTVTATAGVIALGLSAFKLIPVVIWLREFQDQVYASSTFTLPWLYQILAGRYLHGAEVIPNQGGGWHEYGAYVGVPVLILAVIAAVSLVKNRIVRALVLAAILALLVSSLGPFLKPIFDHLDFLPRSNISRLILFAIIPIALLAGHTINMVGTRWPRLSQVVLPLLVALVTLDITSLAYALSQQAFVLPPVLPPVAHAPAPIAYTTRDFKIRVPKNDTQEEDYTRAYAATLAGYGTMSYCSVLTPEPAVRLVTDAGGDKVVEVSDPAAQVALQQWSPNKVVVDVQTTQTSQVMLNTNYANGWLVNQQPAREMGGRVGTLVEPGTHHIIFKYVSPGLTAGLSLTIITSITLIIWLLWQLRARSSRHS